jgi:hypothetical protein
MAAIIWSPIALLPYCPIALFMISASPWWTRHVHVDRRPRLMARNAIQNGLRQWFAERDFVEVTANTLQVSPGNEAHLSAFGTEFLHPDGSRRPYYLHTSPEFACKSCWPRANRACSASDPSIVTVSAGRCITLNSPCWNGIEPANRMTCSCAIAPRSWHWRPTGPERKICFSGARGRPSRRAGADQRR